MNRYMFAACFVVIDKKTREISYIAQSMTGDRYPQNNTKDIMGLCTAMNNQLDEKYRYIDIFAIVLNGETLWEELEDDTETFVPIKNMPTEVTLRELEQAHL